jgi:penicillin amidase
MRIVKFIVSLLITVGLVFVLDNRWEIGSTPVPPLGKFLDPFGGFWRNLVPTDFQRAKLAELAGLQDEVTVVYDSLEIPHIFAKNNLDLYFAQGYITARHRLWQMEFQTHAAAGRVSEIIGGGPNDAILQYDRSQRRLGMVYAARQAMKSLDDNQEALIMLEKYSEGVNAYIASLNYRSLPFEYKLLDYAPEPWTPLKSALFLKSMSQTLCMGDKDIEMTNALALFGYDMVEKLYPDREDIGDPIVDKPNAWPFTLSIPDSVPPALPKALVEAKRLFESDPTTGSNNWALAGSRTTTGSPILCGDPHLDLSLPSLWYVVQLKAPGTNTLGVSLPGLPGIVIGATDSIAWSMTNAQRDLVDWYEVQFRDRSRNQYLLDDEWVDTRKVVETFNVRGKPATTDTVVYTVWGPVPYDANFRPGNNLSGYAFRWIAHDPSDDVVALYKLNRANSYDDFMEALDHFESPATNFAFAAVDGDIAIRVQGKFPLRRKGEGKFVLDGSRRSSGWSSFIPNEQNVMDRNPERGFVSSANQYPVDATYPYYITATSYEAYRNRRINAILDTMHKADPRLMMQLQNDNYNLKAAESLPYFLEQLDTAALDDVQRHAYRVLSDWDYVNHADAEGAAYYEAWWDNLMAVAWDEVAVDGLSMRRPTTFNTIKLLQEEPEFSFFDIKQTPAIETARDVIRTAFSLGVADIEEWKRDSNHGKAGWGTFKASYIGHLARIDPLGVRVNTGGNHDIVNAHTRTHGPSWRMVVSLEKSGIRMWGVYPGGQSGNPGSPHYSDMIARWVGGEYFRIPFYQNAAEHTNANNMVQLRPRRNR